MSTHAKNKHSDTGRSRLKRAVAFCETSFAGHHAGCSTYRGRQADWAFEGELLAWRVEVDMKPDLFASTSMMPGHWEGLEDLSEQYSHFPWGPSSTLPIFCAFQNIRVVFYPFSPLLLLSFFLPSLLLLVLWLFGNPLLAICIRKAFSRLHCSQIPLILWWVFKDAFPIGNFCPLAWQQKRRCFRDSFWQFWHGYSNIRSSVPGFYLLSTFIVPVLWYEIPFVFFQRSPASNVLG